MTAREFALKLDLESNIEIEIHNGYPLYENIYELMREFAKYHVKQALEAALEDSPYGSSTDTVSYEDMKKAILEAYPETNIK